VPLVEASAVQAIYTGANGESSIATNSNMKGIVRQDTGHLIKVFSAGYQIHGYTEFLLNKAARVLDTHSSDLEAKSVGLLKNGAQAWLQIKLSESFEVGGFGYVPFLTAATSADGSLSSQWGVGFDAAVCDNTLSAALLDAKFTKKLKHTAHSDTAETDKAVREALNILFTSKDAFNQSAEMLMSLPVSEAQWNEFMNELVPVPEVKDGKRGGRGATIATNKRDGLNDLYWTDAKAAPWNGTAFGAFQAVNTWQTWSGTVRGADGGRMERFHSNMIDGTTEARDADTLAILGRVLGRELLAV
jgi:phage/plasmid-like protein (TIGR03299 family)